MKIEDIDGVTCVDRPFLSTEISVWAKPPVPRTAPDYNERVYDFAQRVARLGHAEFGYARVKITFVAS